MCKHCGGDGYVHVADNLYSPCAECEADGCTCNQAGFGLAPCAVHLPDFTHRTIEAAAARANAVIDQLARDREAIATAALNAMAELLLDRLPQPARAIAQALWTKLAPVAVERVTMQAASVTVVDERGPGSTVELVDERP